MFPGDECEGGIGVVDEFCECVEGSGDGTGGDGSGDGSGGDGTSDVSEGDHILFIHPKEKWMVRKIEKVTGQKIKEIYQLELLLFQAFFGFELSYRG